MAHPTPQYGHMLVIFFPSSSFAVKSMSAPVGHASTHAPQKAQPASLRFSFIPATILVPAPRPSLTSTWFSFTSEQACTQRKQETQALGLKEMKGLFRRFGASLFLSLFISIPYFKNNSFASPPISPCSSANISKIVLLASSTS